ncbi:hypothetical protein TruAng_010641 [Truncatella angustata]|nr:hypothetical protein TruAng_010641 [Truncatella angustata]
MSAHHSIPESYVCDAYIDQGSDSLQGKRTDLTQYHRTPTQLTEENCSLTDIYNMGRDNAGEEQRPLDIRVMFDQPSSIEPQEVPSKESPGSRPPGLYLPNGLDDKNACDYQAQSRPPLAFRGKPSPLAKRSASISYFDNRKSFYPAEGIPQSPPLISPLSSASSINSQSSGVSILTRTKRAGSLLRDITTRAGASYSRVQQRWQDKREEQARLPLCKNHNRRGCAEHLHWYVGKDANVMHDRENAVLAVAPLKYDAARFDYDSDLMVQPGTMPLPRTFNYAEPKHHWFHYCKSCQLMYLVGNAGDAIKTHPAHIANLGIGEFGERAIAMYVDARHDLLDAQWSIYFGPESAENTVKSSRGIERGTVDMRALRDALEKVSTAVVRNHTDRLLGGRNNGVTVVKSNSEAFLAAACRFTLLLFTPLKAVLTLCANELGEVLCYDSVKGTFHYPEYTMDWVLNRMNPTWLEEKRCAERAIRQLAAEGVQVKFAYMPMEDKYTEKWPVMVP